MWCGAQNELVQLVGQDAPVISALELPGLGVGISGKERIRGTLANALSLWLSGLDSYDGKQSIAIISDLAIMAYYDVGTGPFYQYHANDTHLTVLCVEESQAIVPELPSGLKYDSLAVQKYFRRLLQLNNIVEG